MSWGELYGPFLSSGISLAEVRGMTLREIDRQNKHWASFPPPSLALARIGWALGIEPPKFETAGTTPVTSEEELRSIAASLGVTSGR